MCDTKRIAREQMTDEWEIGYSESGLRYLRPRKEDRHWASHAQEALQAGKHATIRPRGTSMQPKVRSGDEVMLKPVTTQLRVGDIVLVRVKGRVYLHLIQATRRQGDSPVRYHIGNNRGGVNGWVSAEAIYGVATHVAGREVG